MAGREAVQHVDSNAGWRLGRRDSGLNLDPKTQTVSSVEAGWSGCSGHLNRSPNSLSGLTVAICTRLLAGWLGQRVFVRNKSRSGVRTQEKSSL